MVAQMLVKGDFQQQLLGRDSAMTDGELLVDELDGEYGLGSIERNGFLYAWAFISVYIKAWERNLPRIGSLADCLGNDSEGQLTRQRSQLRVSDHGV